MQLENNRFSILKHLAEGGTVTLRVYGKRTVNYPGLKAGACE
jgi:hypothetical protein